MFMILSELFISLFGFFSVDVIRALSTFSSHFISGMDALNTKLLIDFCIFCLILLFPTTAMGISLPILAQAFAPIKITQNHNFGLLYSVNIAGAITGAFVSGIFLIGFFGLHKLALIISGLNLLCPFLAVVFFKQYYMKNQSDWHVLQNTRSHEKALWPIFGIVFLLGCITLAYEIMYFRVLVYYFSAVSYVFPIILSCYLFWMMMGTYASYFCIRSEMSMTSLISFATLGTLLTSPLLYFVPDLIRYLGLTSSDMVFRTYFGTKGFFYYLWVTILISLTSMIPIFFTSMLLPGIVDYSVKRGNLPGESVGNLYFMQTMGNFFGVLITGFYLFQAVGTFDSAKLMVICAGLVGILLIFIIQEKTAKKVIHSFSLIGITVLVVSIFFPSSTAYLTKISPTSASADIIVESKEGTIFGYKGIHTSHYDMRVGAEPIGGFSSSEHRYVTELWPTNIGLTLLSRKPKKFLLIGIGGGSQALVIKHLYPDCDIIIVEILEELIDIQKTYASSSLKQLLNQAEVVISDGRRYVNYLAARNIDKFDYIQIGVFSITSSASGNLFTKEFIETIYKNILAPGGILTFNAHLPAVKAGLLVFNNAVIASRGDNLVADVFFRKPSESEESESMQDPNYWKQKLRDPLFKDKEPFFMALPRAGFLIYDKKKLDVSITDIDVLTDDCIVTSYFLNNTVKFHNAEDPRRWPISFADLCFDSCTESKR